MLIGYDRGQELYFDDVKQQWFYSDTNEPYSYTDIIKCSKCKLDIKENEPDPCLGYLQGVKYACCGHGLDDNAYIMLDNGDIITKKERIPK